MELFIVSQMIIKGVQLFFLLWQIVLTWTRTRSTRYVKSYSWITVKAFDTTIAIVTSGGIATSDASSGSGVTVICVAMTLTTLTMWEIPKAWFTLAARSSVGIRTTLASSGFNVAKVIQCTNAIAIARYTSCRTKSVSSRCATIASSTDYVNFARTQAAIILTKETMRSRRITLASCNKINIAIGIFSTSLRGIF